MAVNKVIYGSDTLIDLTADTVTADKLKEGETAHSADGELITGTMSGGTTIHTDTYTPAVNTSANDMGASHNYRYVDTSGMIKPSGTTSASYTTNGTSTVNVKNYENISITRAVPLKTTRTKLWENSDPDAAFASQTVTLSQSIANFQYIEIEWQNRYSTVTTVSHYEPSVIVRLADFRETANESDHPGVGLYYRHGGALFCRGVNYVSNTQVLFREAYRLNVAGTSTGIIIPLRIYGLSFSV